MSSITVELHEGYRTVISIRDHVVIADEPVQDGGSDSGPTPMEIMLSTAGACVAVMTKAYAQRKNWPLEGVYVELGMERIRREDYPAYSGEAAFVHEIRENIRFDGPLSDDQKARLLVIAGKCPVHVLLSNPVFFAQQLVDSVPQL